LSRLKEFDAGLIALGAALNVSIGYLAGVLKLPLYLDSIGTILVASLCGWAYGAMVGIAALIILALTAVPTVIAYVGTALVIALLSAALGRFGFLRNLKMTLLGGLLLGLAAACASAPITTFLYGGVSLAGADALTTLFRAMGMPLWKSTLLGSLITDTADKLATSLIAFGLVKSLPGRMRERMKKQPEVRSRKSEES
jgi:energy-coupling factor transport system substrate-specific component